MFAVISVCMCVCIGGSLSHCLLCMFGGLDKITVVGYFKTQVIHGMI